MQTCSTGSQPMQLTVPGVLAPHLWSSTVTPYAVFATETYKMFVPVPGTLYAGLLQHSLLSAIGPYFAAGLWHPAHQHYYQRALLITT